MAANIGKQTPFLSEGRNQSNCGRGRLGSRLSQRWSSTLDLLQRPVTVPCLHQGQKPLQTAWRRRQWAARPGPEPTVYPAFHNIPARHAQGEQHEHAEVCCGDLACLPAEFHRQPRPDLESLTSLLIWEAGRENPLLWCLPTSQYVYWVVCVPFHLSLHGVCSPSRQRQGNKKQTVSPNRS